MSAVAGIGHNLPPTLTEELVSRHAALLAAIEAIVAAELPMMVISDAAAAQVSSIGKEAMALAARVAVAHKIEKEPHLQAGREVDAWKNSTLAPLNVFLAECKALVGAWQDAKEAQERAAREAAARQLAFAREAAERQAMQTMAQPDMQRATDIAEAAAVAEAAAAATTADLARVTAGGKAVAARTVKWAYEVVDLAGVPRDLLMIDDSKVRARIAAGEREIQGLRIFQQKNTSFR